MNNETHICGEIRRFYRTFFSVNSQEWTLSQHGWEVLRRLPQMEIRRTNIICWGKPKALEHPLIDLAFRSNNRIQGIAHRVRTERLCVCMYVCMCSKRRHPPNDEGHERSESQRWRRSIHGGRVQSTEHQQQQEQTGVKLHLPAVTKHTHTQTAGHTSFI